MATLFARIRVVAALALLGLFAVATPAAAQPTPQVLPAPSVTQRNLDNSVNPTASSVKEDQLLRELKAIGGRGSIRDVNSYVIEQPAGRDWREFHEVTLRWIGAIVILAMVAAIVIFYLWRGMIRLERGRSGVKIVRFNAFERFVHWMTATCFIIQALTGLNITFGKPLLLPMLGPEAFSAWSQWAKYAHNFLSFPFTLGVILIFFMWFVGNIPNRVDLDWIKRSGGLVGHDHPPAYRFNAGQKAIYWVQVIAGTAIVVTGYLLMFPFYGTTIDGMQLASIIHGVVAMVFVAIMLAHIYIGTIGMEGAFEGMGEGTVDLNWAKEHHALWVEEERLRTGPGDSQPQPAATPAE